MKWTLFLSEVEGEAREASLLREKLPEAMQVGPRLWLWPGWPEPGEERRAVPFMDHPAYGRTYARPIQRGEGLEALRASPVWPEIEAFLRRRLTAASKEQADEARKAAAALGLEELLREAAEKEVRMKAAAAFLGLVGAPFRRGENGTLVVGEDQLILLEDPDEAEAVARAYGWARRHRMVLRPVGRGSQGSPRFFAPILKAHVEDEKAVIPYRGTRKGSAYVALVREGNRVVAQDVDFRVPKRVSLVFI